MHRYKAFFRPFVSAVMVTLVVAWTGAFAADPVMVAQDSSANKSDLIRGLLPTVVNISVKKNEPPAPVAAVADAAGPGPSVGTPTPSPDADSNIKSYVGSGFVIDPSGLIITNYHVVEYAFEVTVMFSDGTRLPGRTLRASRLADLAIVKVDPAQPLAAAHWGNSDTLQVGDQVLAAGNPFGIGLSVSTGIVSGLNRDIQNSPYDDLIQTDAPINHGNSGGPLFDMRGNVVGVNSAIISPTSGSVGLGFAIPAASARFVVDQLLTYGWVHPGWIGVKLQNVTREIADAMGSARAEGSLVSWVLPDAPAKRAGLAIGDVVLRYNGKAPSDDRALLREIAHTTEGDTIILAIRRNGVEQDLSVVAEAWPRNQWEAQDAPQVVTRPKMIIPPDLGLGLAVLGDEEKAKLISAGGMNGVLVTSVAANSDSAQRGVANGDVILRVQEQPVAAPDEVRADISAARASKRDYVLLLVLPKKSSVPGPKWVALRLEAPS